MKLDDFIKEVERASQIEPTWSVDHVQVLDLLYRVKKVVDTMRGMEFVHEDQGYWDVLLYKWADLLEDKE